MSILGRKQMQSVHQSVWSLKYCIFELSLSHVDLFLASRSDSRTAEQLEKQGREQQGNILLRQKATLWVCQSRAIAESPVHSTKGLKALSITKMNSNLPNCLKRKQPRITEFAHFVSPDKSLSFYVQTRMWVIPPA